MINPIDIRLGNLVCYDPQYPLPVPVQAIRTDGVETPAIKLLQYEDIFPIPLTEEWLRRLGFEDNKIRHSYYLELMVRKYITSTQGWIDNAWRVDILDTIPCALGFHFKYIHQLQNLFYSLTGEELQIKEHASK